MKDNFHLIYPVKGQPPVSELLLNKISRYAKQKQDSGHYNPWLHIATTSVCSVGAKVKNEYSNFSHETMSTLETNFLRYLKFLPNVMDVYSQFPLFPIDETLLIASEIGMKHPTFLPKGNIKDEHYVYHACVMTTDFHVSFHDEDGEYFRSPIALKRVTPDNQYSSNPTKHINIKNKLEIERRYWLSKGRTHQIITQKEPYLTRPFVKNLKKAELFAKVDAEPSLISTVKALLDEVVPKMGYYALGGIEEYVARQTNQKASRIHAIIFHLLWHQELLWDMQREIAIHKRIPTKKGAVKCVWQ